MEVFLKILGELLLLEAGFTLQLDEPLVFLFDVVAFVVDVFCVSVCDFPGLTQLSCQLFVDYL